MADRVLRLVRKCAACARAWHPSCWVRTRDLTGFGDKIPCTCGVYDPDEDEERGDRNEPLSTWIDHPKRTSYELKPNNLSLLDLVGAS